MSIQSMPISMAAFLSCICYLDLSHIVVRWLLTLPVIVLSYTNIYLPDDSPVCILADEFIQHQAMGCMGEGWMAQQAVT